MGVGFAKGVFLVKLSSRKFSPHHVHVQCVRSYEFCEGCGFVKGESFARGCRIRRRGGGVYRRYGWICRGVWNLR